MTLKSRYSQPVWLASGVRTPFSKVDGALAMQFPKMASLTSR